MTGEILAGLRNANKETIKAIAEKIAEKARHKAPVKRGILRASIKANARKGRNTDEILGSVSTNTKGARIEGGDVIRGKKKKVGKGEVEQAKTVQYGYGADVEIGRPGGNYKTTPYLRPSLAETIPEIPGILIRGARGEFAKIKGKPGRKKKVTIG